MESNFNSKILLIADYGRSGQGWLSYMLSYILNAAYIEPYNFLVGKRYTASDYVINLTQGDLVDREKTKYSLVVKTHNYPSENFNLPKKVLFLIRDPRDVAVSMHNLHLIHEKSVGWNHPRAKISLLFEKYFKIFDYINTINGWQHYFCAYKKVNHFLVRYENLNKNPEDELNKILNYLDCADQENYIKEAVEKFSFEKITGRKQGQEDKNSTEFRKGIVGDYKNKMSKFEIYVINKLFKKVLKDSGYEVNG